MNTQVTLEQLQAYCQEMGLMSQRRDEDSRVVIVVPGKQIRLGYLLVDAEREVVILRVPGLLEVPEERQAEVARIISHLNYFLVLGKFCLDMRDGEVMWEIVHLYRDLGITFETLLRLLLATTATLEADLPSIEQVAGGGVTAKAILETRQRQVPALEEVLDALRDEGEREDDQASA